MKVDFIEYISSPRVFMPPIVALYFDSESKTVAVADQEGTLLSHDEWRRLQEMINTFYRLNCSDTVKEINSSNKTRWEQERQARRDYPAPRRSLPGYVYMISDGKFTKIGRARNPQARLKDLQMSGLTPLTLLHVLACPDPSEPEAFLHVRFTEQRIRGEWFDLSPVDIDWVKSLTFENLNDLLIKGTPNERFTSWQGLAKQLRRTTKTAGGGLG